MPGKLTIRDAVIADAAVIGEIYNESILTRDSTMITEPLSVGDIRQHFETFSAREGYLVLERDDYVVGWGVIKHFGDGTAYRHSGETSVFLRRNEVRKGYGSRLKRALIERCKAWGYHHLVARIWASNTTSIEYNRAFGYELVGIQQEIGYVDGRWLDIALMQLVLDEVPARKNE